METKSDFPKTKNSAILFIKSVLQQKTLTETKILSSNGVCLVLLLSRMAPRKNIEIRIDPSRSSVSKNNLTEYQRTLVKLYHYPKSALFQTRSLINEEQVAIDRLLKTIWHIQSRSLGSGILYDNTSNKRVIYFESKKEVDRFQHLLGGTQEIAFLKTKFENCAKMANHF